MNMKKINEKNVIKKCFILGEEKNVKQKKI